MKQSIVKIFFAIILSFTSSGVFAVQGFSRACNLLSLKNHYYPAHQAVFDFFRIAGMSQVDRLNLLQLSDTELSKYWVNESFTADSIGVPRYYLFARNAVRSAPIFVTGPGTTPTFVQNFESPNWSSLRINTAALPNNVSAIFDASHLGFFGRAGYPGIIQKFSDTNLRYEVEGQHVYYNPANKVTTPLLGSFAKDCNFSWSWAWL